VSLVAVTGASGFVGQGVVEALRSGGHDVLPVVRRAARQENDALAVGNLGENPDWSGILRGVDCLVHCAARAHVVKEGEPDPLSAFRLANRDLTLTLARAAAAAGVRRFVFLSSVGVLGAETKGRGFRADDAIAPHSDYAISKAEAESGLLEIAAETGLEIVIIRAPLVLGRGAKGNLATLARSMRRHIPLPLALATRNRRDLVSLGTLADLIVRSVDHPGAPGQPLLVADGEPLSTRGIVERLARLEGVRPHLLPVPLAVLRAALRVLGADALASQLLGDLEVDIKATCERLDWRPPAPDLGQASRQ